MREQMARTAEHTRPTRAENAGTLPARFVPKFWSDADRRVAIIREIESRVERMKADANADSYQKEVLAERAVFLISILETSERDAIEGSKAHHTGGYVQAINSLIGVLKALGLERKAKAIGLAKYVEECTSSSTRSTIRTCSARSSATNFDDVGAVA